MIKPTVFSAVCISFIFGFLIQVIWWRIKLPVSEMRVISRIHFALCVIVPVVLLNIGYISYLKDFLVEFNYIQFVHFLFFYGAVLVSYLISYTAIKAIGPTFLILLHLEKSIGVGLNREAMQMLITDELFLGDRFNELIDGGYVKLDDQNVLITSKGRWYLLFFTFLRKIAGIRYTGG